MHVQEALLLIDELDKMDGKDVSALMSMEGGRVSRIKVGRMADATLECTVVAASNTLRLPPELLSRFAIKRLHPCTTEQSREVVVGLLQRREGLNQAVAAEIARTLDGRTRDVREAVRVDRLSGQVGVKRAVELLLA